MAHKNKYQRTLSVEGEQELGHIFTGGYLPLIQWTPIYANLRGEPSRVFLVDWNALSEQQQDLVIEFMTSAFADGVPDIIRSDISKNGHFPIRCKYVIESYDLRLLQ